MVIALVHIFEFFDCSQWRTEHLKLALILMVDVRTIRSGGYSSRKIRCERASGRLEDIILYEAGRMTRSQSEENDA